jgi:cyclopropane fatty-acyl-phospholipid synthase-like methyltransferase
MNLFFTIILFAIPLYIIYLFGYSVLKGGPYAPVSHSRVKIMIKLLNLKKGQKMVDIGSGDGRIIIAFAQKGIEAHGYEINPLLFLYTKWQINQMELQKKAFVHLSDLWKTDLSKYDAVTLFGITHMMQPLETKFNKELKKGAKFVTNHFKLPNWKPEKSEDDVWLYIKKT